MRNGTKNPATTVIVAATALVLALLATLLAPWSVDDAAASTPPPHGPTQLCVTVPPGDTLNLRNGPGTAHHVVAEIPSGSCNLHHYGTVSGSWFRVEFRRQWGTTTGWVHSAYVIGTPPPPIVVPPILPPPPIVPPAPPVQLCVTSPDTLNLRTGPGTGYSIIAAVPDGDCNIFAVGEASGAWRKVQWLQPWNAPIGWMHSSYLRPVANPPYPGPIIIPPPPPPAPVVLMCVNGIGWNDSLNVRSGPSTGYSVLASMRPGTCGMVDLGEQSGGWLKITFSRYGRQVTGWAFGKYLAPGQIAW